MLEQVIGQILIDQIWIEYWETTTFNNPVLIKNNVILLTERLKAETFFKSQYLNLFTLEKIIKKSFINENGEVEGEYEPLLCILTV